MTKSRRPSTSQIFAKSLPKDCKIQAPRRPPTKPDFAKRWRNSGSQKACKPSQICQKMAKFRLPEGSNKARFRQQTAKFKAPKRPPTKSDFAKRLQKSGSKKAFPQSQIGQQNSGSQEGFQQSQINSGSQKASSKARFCQKIATFHAGKIQPPEGLPQDINQMNPVGIEPTPLPGPRTRPRGRATTLRTPCLAKWFARLRQILQRPALLHRMRSNQQLRRRV